MKRCRSQDYTRRRVFQKQQSKLRLEERPGFGTRRTGPESAFKQKAQTQSGSNHPKGVVYHLLLEYFCYDLVIIA